MAGPDFPISESRVFFPVTIANGQSLSEAVNLGGYVLVGIHMPAAWTAASLTLQGSAAGATFGNVFDDEGTELEVDAAASRYIPLGPEKTCSLAHVKVRSGTSGSPVNQEGARTLTLVARDI